MRIRRSKITAKRKILFNKLQSEFNSKLNRFMGEVSMRVFTFYKGRVGLFALLRSIGVGPNDEVILPAYTCVVVPNAIKYAGALPRYVDIDIETYSARPSMVLNTISSKTKAVICQNTYGLSFGVDEISRACRIQGIKTIEDCAHGFSGTYKGKPNGVWCNAAFYSSQWNKPISTGVGGYVLVNDSSLEKSVKDFAEALPSPSFGTESMLWILMRIRPLITSANYYHFVNTYRHLSKLNVVPGSSTGEELLSPDMPPNYLMGISKVQLRAAIRALDLLPAVNALRKANGSMYTNHLKMLGKNAVAPELHEDHLFLKYPLLVWDRAEFMQRAQKARISLGDWFRSPLHPIEGDLSCWDFDPALYPNAVFSAAHVVNLPTDVKNPKRVLEFLDKNADLILSVDDVGRRNG